MADRKRHRGKSLELDASERLLIVGQDEHRLTPKEFRLLKLFLEHPHQVLTRRFLMEAVWEGEALGDTRTLNVHICWLRKKLGDRPPRRLTTIYGVGYCFEGEMEGGDVRTNRRAP